MLLRSSYQREIDRFCKVILGGDYDVRQVSKSALSQARKKLNSWAFQRLNEVAVDSFYEGAEINVWRDMRVLAVDGSRLRLPQSEDIAREFGKPGFGPNANSETSVASCSLLYDVLNHITIDAQIGPYTESERGLLDKHFAKIERGDLLLADRGYPGYKLMLKLLEKGVEFCFRMNENWWKAIKGFNNTNNEDALVELQLPKKVVEQYGQEILTIRLIKVKYKAGKSIVLGTSLLDRKKYPYDQFRALYHLRWDIEETYKLLKSRIEIEAFSGRTARSVRQDFHAKVFMMNLCATLSYPIEERVKKEYHEEKTGNKYSQKMNNTNAISLTKDNLIRLLYVFKESKIKLFFQAFDKIIESTREVVRPQRNFSRKKSKVRSKIHYTNYKCL